MERDYAAEMRAVIDSEAQGSYASPLVAQEISEKLEANDRDLLEGWLWQQRVQFLRHAINLRDCSVRTHNRMTATRSVFRSAAAAAEAGDPEPLRTQFMAEVYLTEDGLKMPLRDMRAAELTFAADDFAQRARDNAMKEAFLRALAKKCRTKAVGEVFDEDKLAKLWLSTRGDQ